jgi:hypothetical protein
MCTLLMKDFLLTFMWYKYFGNLILNAWSSYSEMVFMIHYWSEVKKKNSPDFPPSGPINFSIYSMLFSGENEVTASISDESSDMI